MRYSLGGVNDAATADGQDKVSFAGDGLLYGLPYPAEAGIRLDAAFGLGEHTGCLQGGFDFSQQAAFYHTAAAVDNEYSVGVISGQFFGGLILGAPAKDDFCGHFKVK